MDFFIHSMTSSHTVRKVSPMVEAEEGVNGLESPGSHSETRSDAVLRGETRHPDRGGALEVSR